MIFSRKIHWAGKYSALSLPLPIAEMWKVEGYDRVFYHYNEKTGALNIVPMIPQLKSDL
jgi:hypothetical protein